MEKILVSGLINIETAVRVAGFPIHYAPVHYPFWGVRSTVSGVGYNIAKALTTLGQSIRFLSLIGSDLAGEMVLQTADKAGIPTTGCLRLLGTTAQSAILYDPDGRRQIHVDLKDAQGQAYPPAQFVAALAECHLAVLCNINWNRPFLVEAKAAGKLAATDVHAIHDLDDNYNRDFMATADILFMSDERLPVAPETWARQVQARFGPPILVIGLGSRGALLAVRDDNFIERVPVVTTRPVVNSVGAGDALFSSFLHAYSRTGDPYTAIRQAVVFASYKIGIAGAAEGFLTVPELTAWLARVANVGALPPDLRSEA
jgi:acarbose 7IV-phosphotransferase